MRVHTSRKFEEEGRWFRQRYWKCRVCGLQDQTTDEEAAPEEAEEQQTRATRRNGGSRLARLRRFRRH